MNRDNQAKETNEKQKQSFPCCFVLFLVALVHFFWFPFLPYLCFSFPFESSCFLGGPSRTSFTDTAAAVSANVTFFLAKLSRQGLYVYRGVARFISIYWLWFAKRTNPTKREKPMRHESNTTDATNKANWMWTNHRKLVQMLYLTRNSFSFQADHDTWDCQGQGAVEARLTNWHDWWGAHIQKSVSDNIQAWIRPIIQLSWEVWSSVRPRRKSSTVEIKLGVLSLLLGWQSDDQNGT